MCLKVNSSWVDFHRLYILIHMLNKNNAMLVCWFIFHRPDPVLWTKDGGELPDPERMVVSGRELVINSLNKTDNGTYRCEAENTIGLNSAEYVLIIHGKCISLCVFLKTVCSDMCFD